MLFRSHLDNLLNNHPEFGATTSSANTIPTSTRLPSGGDSSFSHALNAALPDMDTTLMNDGLPAMQNGSSGGGGISVAANGTGAHSTSPATTTTTATTGSKEGNVGIANWKGMKEFKADFANATSTIKKGFQESVAAPVKTAFSKGRDFFKSNLKYIYIFIAAYLLSLIILIAARPTFVYNFVIDPLGFIFFLLVLLIVLLLQINHFY